MTLAVRPTSSSWNQRKNSVCLACSSRSPRFPTPAAASALTPITSIRIDTARFIDIAFSFLMSCVLDAPQKLPEGPDGLRSGIAGFSQPAGLEDLAGANAAAKAFHELAYPRRRATMCVGIENPGCSGLIASHGERVFGILEVTTIQAMVGIRPLRNRSGQAVRHVLPKQANVAGRIQLRLHGVAPLMGQNCDRGVVAIGAEIGAGILHHSGEEDRVVVNTVIRSAVG